MAELALVTPILLLLIMAVVQFAVVFKAQMGLTNAVREAARRAAADPAPTVTGIEGQLDMLLATNIQGFDAGNPGLSRDAAFSEYCLLGENNSRVTVTVTYGHPVFFPLLDYATDLIDGLDDDMWTLTATAQMRLETPRFPGSC